MTWMECTKLGKAKILELLIKYKLPYDYIKPGRGTYFKYCALVYHYEKYNKELQNDKLKQQQQATINQPSAESSTEQPIRVVECSVYNQGTESSNKIQQDTVYDRHSQCASLIHIKASLLSDQDITRQFATLEREIKRADARGDNFTARMLEFEGKDLCTRSRIRNFEGMSRSERYNYLKAKRDAHLARKAVQSD